MTFFCHICTRPRKITYTTHTIDGPFPAAFSSLFSRRPLSVFSFCFLSLFSLSLSSLSSFCALSRSRFLFSLCGLLFTIPPHKFDVCCVGTMRAHPCVCLHVSFSLSSYFPFELLSYMLPFAIVCSSIPRHRVPEIEKSLNIFNLPPIEYLSSFCLFHSFPHQSYPIPSLSFSLQKTYHHQTSPFTPLLQSTSLCPTYNPTSKRVSPLIPHKIGYSWLALKIHQTVTWMLDPSLRTIRKRPPSTGSLMSSKSTNGELSCQSIAFPSLPR